MINRTHVWFAAFVLIVFAGGLAAGVALDRSVWRGGRAFAGPGAPGGGFRGGDRGQGGPSRGEGRGTGDGPAAEMFVRELDNQLALTPEQEKQITDVINASRPQMRALQEEASKRFAAEQQALHDAIVKVLTPEQAKKFEEMPRGPFGFRRGGRGR
ncbi:MAG: hypothetical protein EPO35_00940 [Acidobacteria bacterium]|nr:MAG: hypothetical protein EPO35_00940 [Acidobacteriota bacterium]